MAITVSKYNFARFQIETRIIGILIFKIDVALKEKLFARNMIVYVTSMTKNIKRNYKCQCSDC